MGKRIKGKTGKAKPAKKVTEEPGVAAPSGKHLVWRFGRMDHGGEFACQTLVATHVEDLECELVTFQLEPIRELRRKGWLKFIPIDEMTPASRGRLSEINEQENGLWQLHLHRYKWRVWGYFDDPEFYFLWWDNDHRVATGKWRNRRT